jgi:hypothetical protein
VTRRWREMREVQRTKGKTVDKKLVRAMRLDPSPTASRALVDYLNEHGEADLLRLVTAERNLLFLAQKARDDIYTATTRLGLGVSAVTSKAKFAVVRIVLDKLSGDAPSYNWGRNWGRKLWVCQFDRCRTDDWIAGRCRRDVRAIANDIARWTNEALASTEVSWWGAESLHRRKLLLDVLSMQLLE